MPWIQIKLGTTDKKAEKIAKEAEELIGNGWTKVVRVYPREEET